MIASGSLGGLTMIFFSASRSAGRGLSDEPARAGIAAGSGVAAGAAAGVAGNNDSSALRLCASMSRFGSACAAFFFFEVFFAAFCEDFFRGVFFFFETFLGAVAVAPVSGATVPVSGALVPGAVCAAASNASIRLMVTPTMNLQTCRLYPPRWVQHNPGRGGSVDCEANRRESLRAEDRLTRLCSPCGM